MIRLIAHGQATDRPPLYAVPGLDGSIGSIEPVVNRLARQRQVIVIDFSAATNETLESLVADMAAAVKAEARPTFDIMGQSIGTIMAAQLASSHDLPVRKVVLTCTFTRLRWTALRFVAAMTRMTPDFLYRVTSPLAIRISSGPVGDGGDHPAFAATRSSDKRIVAQRTLWQVDRDFSADLVKIASPLLILMGEQDRFVPNAQKEIAKLRQLFDGRPAQIEAIPNAGHIFLPSAAVASAVTHIERFLA